jgi:hypothetical protein
MWVVSFTPRPLGPGGNSPRYPFSRRLVGPQNQPSNKDMQLTLRSYRLCATSVIPHSSVFFYMFRSHRPSAGVHVVVIKESVAHCDADLFLLFTTPCTPADGRLHVDNITAKRKVRYVHCNRMIITHGAEPFLRSRYLGSYSRTSQQVFTTALHWSLFWARSIQSIPSYLIFLRSIKR